MSTGMLIHLPQIDRIMIPFVHMDNHEITDTIQSRIEQAKKNTTLANDHNFHIINAVIEPFIALLDKEHDKQPHHQPFLMFAGEICVLVRNAKLVDHKTYERNLIRLKRAMKRHNVNPMEPGMDQVIARLNYMMRFEDPIQIWDYYALWAEDFGNNGQYFEGEQLAG